MSRTIPKHTNCKNCGQCCGPVPVNEKEYGRIVKFVEENKPRFNKNDDILKCKFRVDNKCSIYPVRPTLCKLMGVAKGLTCSYGNSSNINGFKFMDYTSKTIGLINLVIKTNY